MSAAPAEPQHLAASLLETPKVLGPRKLEAPFLGGVAPQPVLGSEMRQVSAAWEMFFGAEEI